MDQMWAFIPLVGNGFWSDALCLGFSNLSGTIFSFSYIFPLCKCYYLWSFHFPEMIFSINDNFIIQNFLHVALGWKEFFFFLISF